MDILNGKLLGTAILVRKPEVQEKTKGGVFLPPELVDEKNNTVSSRDKFKVISIGHQVVNIAPNDFIFPHRNAAHNHHTFNGIDYTIIDESEVVMVFQAIDKELITPQTAIKLLK